MTPSLTPPKLAHTSRASHLLRASALSLSIPQGMRQGGGTRGTIRSAAHFPSKAALELGRNLIKPCRKASEQAPVVVRGKLALPGRSVKADSHLRSSSALRLSQDEDDRGTKECPTNVIPVSETKVPRIR